MPPIGSVGKEAEVNKLVQTSGSITLKTSGRQGLR